jgi:hypothetical protein
MGADDFGQGSKVQTDLCLVCRVVAPDFYVWDAQQTRGESSEVPLCADVWAGTDEHFEAVLGGEGEEGFEVALPRGEVELSPLDFVQVPKDVNAQRIQAQCLDGEHAVLPILPRDAWVVHLPRTDRPHLQNVVDLNIAWLFLFRFFWRGISLDFRFFL